MPPIRGPAVPRRRLGAELRRLRDEAGFLIDEVASQLECSPSKISRLENGKGIPKLRDVRDMLDMYSVDDRALRERLLRWARDGQKQGWWHDYTDSPELNMFIALESDASRHLSFQTTLMPGLLQTPDYARAIIKALTPHYVEDDVELLVELRMRRQREVLRREKDPLELHYVLDEGVVRRRVGPSWIMRDQLRRLLEAAEQTSAFIQVLPFTAGPHQGWVGSFELLEFTDTEDHDVLSVEKLSGNSYSEADDEILRYRQAFVDLSGKALDAGRSAAFIEAAIETHRD